MNGCELLEEALRKGGKVEWTPPGKPQLFVPKGMGVLFQQDIETVREVLRRAALFREQAQTPGPVPLLVLPGYQGDTDDRCVSCGVRVDSTGFRCALCRLAVTLALET